MLLAQRGPCCVQASRRVSRLTPKPIQAAVWRTAATSQHSNSSHTLPSQRDLLSNDLPQQQQQQQQEQEQQQQAVREQSQLHPLRTIMPLYSAGAAAVVVTAVALSTAGAADAAAQPLLLLSDLDAASAHSLESILRPLFAAFTVLYIIRIPMTWYPSIDGTKLPWLLAYAPTEPILKVTRNVIPLVGGVDITPIVWVGLISFFNEILLGPQGILMLIQRESGAGLL